MPLHKVPYYMVFEKASWPNNRVGVEPPKSFLLDWTPSVLSLLVKGLLLMGISDHSKKPLLTAWVWGWTPPRLGITHRFHSPNVQWFEAKPQRTEECTVLNFCFKNENQRWDSHPDHSLPMVWKQDTWVVSRLGTSISEASYQPLPPPLVPTVTPLPWFSFRNVISHPYPKAEVHLQTSNAVHPSVELTQFLFLPTLEDPRLVNNDSRSRSPE